MRSLIIIKLQLLERLVLLRNNPSMIVQIALRKAISAHLLIIKPSIICRLEKSVVELVESVSDDVDRDFVFVAGVYEEELVVGSVETDQGFDDLIKGFVVNCDTYG